MADHPLDFEPLLQKVVYGRYNVEILFIPFRKEWNDTYGETLLPKLCYLDTEAGHSSCREDFQAVFETLL